MLKPSGEYGRIGPLSKSAYTSAMNYSGAWVVVAILSILLGIETFLTHLKVYIGIESVSTNWKYSYTPGWNPLAALLLLIRKLSLLFQHAGKQTSFLIQFPSSYIYTNDIHFSHFADLWLSYRL